MSLKCQIFPRRLTFRNVLELSCDVRIIILFSLIAILPPNIKCAKLSNPQIRLLINDEDLLREKSARHASPGGAQSDHSGEHFNLYRSELKRLSYETIHRILRDENEPSYRREDTELRYYQKRSPSAYQQKHQLVKRSPPQVALNYSRQHLTEFEVTSQIAKDLTSASSLDLSLNRLASLNLSQINCSHLQALNLSNNNFNHIPLEANSSLLSLNLNHNHIKSSPLPANLYLHHLYVAANDIDLLSSLNLSLLKNLETLDVSCNHLQSLETSFFPQRMHNLKHLNLAHNRLGSIYRETFYNLLSLNTLLLGHNNISDIDYETFLALPNLQYLDLSYNRLKGKSIRALQGITGLVALNIAFNEELGPYMQEFVASWSLKELDASGTGLCQIPAALAQSVRSLKLTHNWLKTINCGDLDSYPLLQHLDLSFSRIEHIEDDALGRLEILEVLMLDHNSLTRIPVSLPVSLEHLFLSNNNIMDIQPQAFQGLASLKTLDLSHNKLLYLPDIVLPKLQTLNLQSAEIKGISQGIVHTLPRLNELLLEDNPIKCTDLLGIAEWASTCRLRTNKEDNSMAAEGMEDGSDLKMPLMKRFEVMHDFYEQFGGEQCQKPGKQQEKNSQPLCINMREQSTEKKKIKLATAIKNAPALDKPAKHLNTLKQTKLVNFNLNSMIAIPVPAKKAAPAAVAINATPSSPSFVATNFSGVNASIHGPRPTLMTTSAPANVHALQAFASKDLPQVMPANGTLASPQGDSSDSSLLTTEAATTKQTTTSTKAATTTKATMKPTRTTLEVEAATTSPMDLRAASSPLAKQKTADQRFMPVQPMLMTTLHPMVIATRAPEGTSTNVKAINPPQLAGPASASSFVFTHSVRNGTKINLLKKSIRQEKEISTELANTKNQTFSGAATTTAIHMNDGQTEAMVDTASTTIPISSTSTISTNTATPTIVTSTIPSTMVALPSKNVVTSGQDKSQINWPNQNSNNNTLRPSLHITSRPTEHPTQSPPPPTSSLLAEHHKDATSEAEDSQDNSTIRHPSSTPLTAAALNADPSSPSECIPSPNGNGCQAPVEPKTAQHQDLAITVTMPSTPLENTTKSVIPAHKHEPLQLHIKDRHLIGTPLLMHQGDNILVATDELAKPSLAQDAEKTQTTSSILPVTTPLEVTSTSSVTPQLATGQFKSPKPHSSHEPYEHKGETIKDNSYGEYRKEASDLRTKNPSLIMKKMTIVTKQHELASQPELHQHAENEIHPPKQLLSENHYQELKPLLHVDEPRVITHGPPKHSTVNTPLHQHEPQTFQHEHELMLQQILQDQQQDQHDKFSKTEQWSDLRKAGNKDNHPGLILLVSSGLFVVLLLGLMHVYRCDVPWRRNSPAHHLRPHQRHNGSAEDDVHSFLSYNEGVQKWHHSARLEAPYSSPLHNLHVRELQKTSCTEQPATFKAAASYFNRNPARTHILPRNNSQSSSATTRTTSPSSSAILDDETFYIEMAPSTGQFAQSLQSELLPMELLNMAQKKHDTTDPTSEYQTSLEEASVDLHVPSASALARSTQDSSETLAPLAPASSDSGLSHGRNKTSYNTRKFGVW